MDAVCPRQTSTFERKRATVQAFGHSAFGHTSGQACNALKHSGIQALKHASVEAFRHSKVAQFFVPWFTNIY